MKSFLEVAIKIELRIDEIVINIPSITEDRLLVVPIEGLSPAMMKQIPQTETTNEPINDNSK